MRVAFLVSILLAACNPYDPDLGDAPFRCGTSAPQCPEGYITQQDMAICICVRPGGGDGGTNQPDAGGGPTDCNDDSSFEPNNRHECAAGESAAVCESNGGSATPTAIGAAATTTNFNDMAICPGSDKDHFRMNIPQAGTDITVTVDFEIGGGELQVDILNSTGSSIATGSQVSSGRVEAVITANIAGTYYARVQSAGGEDNNYDVRMSIAPP